MYSDMLRDVLISGEMDDSKLWYIRSRGYYPQSGLQDLGSLALSWHPGAANVWST